MNTPWRSALLASRKRGLKEYGETLAAHDTCRGLHGTIARISLSPIKALGMLDVRSARVTPQGLATLNGFPDRALMLGEAVEGKPWAFTRFSQRDDPTLALVIPKLGDTLAYIAPNMPELELFESDMRPAHGSSVGVRLSGDDEIAQVVPENGHMTEWFREFLHRNSDDPVRAQRIHVLRRPKGFTRAVEERHACGIHADTLFSDGGQLLVASDATLRWMNERIAEKNRAHVPQRMEAFRPNLVLDGLPPNLEDVVASMDVDGQVLLFGGMCVRCPVTRVDTLRGEQRTDKQPLAFLGTSRPARPPENAGATFGVNCVLTRGEGPWILRAGTPFRVLDEK